MLVSQTMVRSAKIDVDSMVGSIIGVGLKMMTGIIVHQKVTL